MDSLSEKMETNKEDEYSIPHVQQTARKGEMHPQNNANTSHHQVPNVVHYPPKKI